MYQVRTFDNSIGPGSTSDQANRWLEKFAGEIEPISVARGDNATGHYLTILFRILKK